MSEMKHEYHEGPKAGERFTKLATAVLQKPKTSMAAPVQEPTTKVNDFAREIPFQV